jgi:hypothetical protein
VKLVAERLHALGVSVAELDSFIATDDSELLRRVGLDDTPMAAAAAPVAPLGNAFLRGLWALGRLLPGGETRIDRRRRLRSLRSRPDTVVVQGTEDDEEWEGDEAAPVDTL